MSAGIWLRGSYALRQTPADRKTIVAIPCCGGVVTVVGSAISDGGAGWKSDVGPFASPETAGGRDSGAGELLVWASVIEAIEDGDS